MTNVNQQEMEKLFEAAWQAAENSYSPYSEFRVGAALRLTNGETVTGTNVENVSYGLTVCASGRRWRGRFPNSGRRSGLRRLRWRI